MRHELRLCAAVGAGLVVLVVSQAAAAQKPGGILKSYSIDSPASMSIHEEATVFAVRPMMAVMNNLVTGRQMARRQALQRRGRQMHLGPAARPIERQVAP